MGKGSKNRATARRTESLWFSIVNRNRAVNTHRPSCDIDIASRQVYKKNSISDSTRRINMIEASKYSAFEGAICDKGFHEEPSIFRLYYISCAQFFFSIQALCFPVSKLESVESKPESLDPKYESLDITLTVSVPRIELNRLIDCQLTFGRYCTCGNTLAKIRHLIMN